MFRKRCQEAGINISLGSRELWERQQTWSYRLLGFDLNNKEISSRIGLNYAMTNTEWFKQVNLESQSMLNGSLNFEHFTNAYLKSLGVPEAEIESRASQTDLLSPVGRYFRYGVHVTEKLLSPFNVNLGFGGHYNFK